MARVDEAGRQRFLHEMLPYANKVAGSLNVDPRLILARWAGETNWGQAVLPDSYNLGNVVEVRKGVKGIVARDNGNKRKFRKFDSFADYADYEEGLLRRRYKDALNTDDPMRHFEALKRGGYAEADNYSEFMGKDMYNSIVRRMPTAPVVSRNAPQSPARPAPMQALASPAAISAMSATVMPVQQYQEPKGQAGVLSYDEILSAVSPQLDKALLSAVEEETTKRRGVGSDLSKSLFSPIKLEGS